MGKEKLTLDRVARQAAGYRALIEDYDLHNRGIDMAAMEQIIDDRQKFFRRHVLVFEPMAMAITYKERTPAVRDLLIWLINSPVERPADILTTMVDLGIAVLTLAESRMARDIDDLAERAAAK